MPVTTVQSIVNTFIGTGSFRFLPGAALPATPALPAGYLMDFGEGAYTVKSGGDLKMLKTAAGGVVGNSKKRRVNPTLMIERDYNYLSPDILGYYSGTGNTGGTPSFGKVVEGFGWFGLQMEDENVNVAGSGIWVYHSFPCDIVIDGDLKADGEDFGMLKLVAEAMLGRGRGTVVISTRPVTA